MPVRDWVQGFTPPEGDGVDPVAAFRDGVIEEYGRDESAWHARESQLTEENTTLTNELRDARAANWQLFNQLPSDKAKEKPALTETPETEQQKHEALKNKIFKLIER